MQNHVTTYHKQSSRTVVGTPRAFFERLNAEFGFTVDVCALADNAKCARFFDPETDGLAQDWGGEVCWMNPPYGKECAAWLRKARLEAEKGATVVCLIPSRTDTRWWHEDVMKAHEIRFVKGRITFEGESNPAPFPCAVVVFKPAAASLKAMEYKSARGPQGAKGVEDGV